MGSAVSYLSLAQRIPLNGSFRDGHDLWASAVLPRSSPMLVKFGVAAVVVAPTAGMINGCSTSWRGPRRAAPAAHWSRALDAVRPNSSLCDQQVRWWCSMARWPMSAERRSMLLLLGLTCGKDDQ